MGNPLIVLPTHANPVGKIAALGGADVAVRAANFLTFAVAARRLSSPDFAAFAVAQTIIGFLVIAVDPGLASSAVAAIASEPNHLPAYRRGLLRFRLSVAVGVNLLCAVYLVLAGETQTAICTACSAPWLIAFALNREWQLQAARRYGTIAAARMISSLIALGFTVCFGLALLPASPAAISAYRLPGELAAAGLAALALKSERGNAGGDCGRMELAPLFRRAGSFLSSQISTLFYTSGLDLLFLAWIKGPEAAALYAAAARLYALFGMLPKLLITVLLPFFAAARAGRWLRRLNFVFSIQFWGVLALLTPLMVAIGSAPASYLAAVYGPRYSDAAAVLAILLAAAVFQSSGALFATTVLTSDQPQSAAKSYGLGAITFVIVNLASVWAWGAVGTAAATLCTEVAVALAAYVFCRRARLLNPSMPMVRLGRALAGVSLAVSSVVLALRVLAVGRADAWALGAQLAISYVACLACAVVFLPGPLARALALFKRAMSLPHSHD